jgi:hypothetical protein
MKTFKYFPLIFIAQVILLFLIPGLHKGVEDLIWLISISLIFGVVFIFGAVRMISDFDISQSRFNARYFGTMGFRMFMGIILIIIYLKFSSVMNKPGTIFLICSYFVYMGFEIRIILSKLRTNSEKPKNADDAQK